MKKPRFFLILIISILASFILSACGGTLINSWPGASANQEAIYVSFQGAVYAINPQNGALLWSFPAEPDAKNPFYAAPGIGPDGLVVVGNYSGHTLYGINPNGSTAWDFTARNGNFVASPLVTESLIVAPNSDGHLYVLDKDGVLVWEYDTGNTLWSQPASDGQLVFIPSVDHNLYAFRLEDGELVWTKDLGSALLSTPVIASDGVMYITTLEGQVIALIPENGAIVWETATEGRIWSSPAFSDDILYVGNGSGTTANTRSGKIMALSAADGGIIWEQSIDSPVIGGAVILSDSDAVVFPTEMGNLIAWSLNGEKQLWAQPVNGKLYTTPVIAGDTLAVSVAEGDKLVQAFSNNGQLTWTFTVPE